MPEAAFEHRLEEAVSLYLTAMGYNPSIYAGRLIEWSRQPTQRGFAAVAAIAHPAEIPATETLFDHNCKLVGVGYSRTGVDSHWWHQQVRAGLHTQGWSVPSINALLSNYAELSEIHVLPQFQGEGLGKQMLQLLIAQRTEAAMLLSTPEFPNEANGAWRLYRQFGFADVLRNFHFGGDSRPFAVLGLRLPQ